MNATALSARIEQRAPEYGSIPFWSWNDKLEDEELRRQIRLMKDLRMGGFFMHARGGLETEYLSDAWFHAVDVSIDEAKKCGMQAWAYDENGWPSGFAGGKLLQDRRNWAVGLFCDEVDAFPADEDTVAAYVPNADGSFTWVQAPVAGCGRYLRIHLQRDNSYVDVLDPDITREFLRLTHEEYRKRIPAGDFGGSMPGFFTDEPQYFRWGHTYSLTLPKAFREAYGYDIFPGLPALFHRDVPGGTKFRHDYFKLLHERFIECWVKIVYEWCAAHGVQLTGHTVEETSLGGQLMCCGGVMPFYEYEDIPGIDYLSRGIQADIAPKQLGSVCAQLGKPKALSEMYGCCGWDVSPRELKRIADLQYANGVNLMCQHLYPYSNRGQRKREYPAHYSAHNPWVAGSFRRFDLHYDRLGAALSEGAEVAPVLVVHPVHGAYMQYRKDQNWHEKIEGHFFGLSALLGENQVPYHYGDEWLLRKYGRAEGGRIVLGKCTYDMVVVPFTYTLDYSTAALLKEYLAQGGRLWLYKDAPTCIDGEAADLSWLRATATWKDVLALRDAVLSAPEGVKHLRKMTRRLPDGSSLVFLANVETQELPCVTVDLPGASRACELDLDAPEGAPMPVRAVHGETLPGGGLRLRLRFEDAESHLLVIDGEESPALLPGAPEVPASVVPVPAEAELRERPENVFPMDIAEFSKDGVHFDEPLSLYGIKDNLLKARYEGDVWLRFRFDMGAAWPQPPRSLRLAIEPMHQTSVTVNGHEIATDPAAWWWDPSLATADIASYVHSGENEVVVRLSYYQRPEVYDVLYGAGFEALRNCLDFDTEIEVPYIVGDFAVRSTAPFLPDERNSVTCEGPFTLGPQRDRVALADVVPDGYPFFCGTLRAAFPYEYRKGGATVLALAGRFSTCRVRVNGAEAGLMLFDHALDIAPFLREGTNDIELELVNSPRNVMGPHHRQDPEPHGLGPNTFSFEHEWNGRVCEGYVPRYAFVRFGVETAN